MINLKLPELVQCDISGVSFFTDQKLFDLIGTRIAFTKKCGGVSKGPYAGLNLGSHVNDEADAVNRNRRLALDAIGATSSVSLICPNQVHGNNICEVCSSCGQEFEDSLEEAKSGVDAMLVRCKDVCAMLCYADCVPVIGVSPTGAFVVIHAGWRGVANRIVEEALLQLCEAEAVQPNSVNIYIGPYIHEECFEVGPDTYDIFEAGFSAHKDLVCKGGNHVDLGAAIKASVIDSGFAKERIADIDKCTFCNCEDFFSYRATGGNCGRHGALAFRS